MNDDKPMNNWVVRSTQSSMRSSLFSGASNRITAVPTYNNLKALNKSVMEASQNESINDGDKSIKLSEDLRSQFDPYNKPGSQNRLFNRSARSSFSNQKRGITPAPVVPLKLIKPMKQLHETGFNIITNRDKNDTSPGPLDSKGKVMTQQERDYQDYTKSEYSFDYNKVKGNKKFSTHRVARKYSDYYSKKKDREIPPFIKELIETETKLQTVLDDVYELKVSFNEKEL